MKALVLRLDAPMMSFGGVMVDQHGVIDRFPGVALLTGLIANALGWHHGDFGRLQALQGRLDFAARWDVQPEGGADYHTVDLGRTGMREPGWTTREVPEHRSGGSDAKYGIHQTYRDYWVDGLMTVVVTVDESDGPSLDSIENALRRPSRPLFLGRKTCLPARPLLDATSPAIEGDNLVEILCMVPIWNRDGEVTADDDPRESCWPAEIDGKHPSELRRVHDLRDWANQLPSGSRERREGMLGGEGAA